jgi:DNA-binding CsgD family transcriptional regulator
MKPNTKLLHDYWDQSGWASGKDVELDRLKLDEIIATVFSNGPYYFYVVDFFDRKISFMSPHVKEIHGLDPLTTKFQNILDLIHPEDMEYVVKAESAVANMLFVQLGKERQHKYKVSYCFRMKTTDGSYKLFNHQAMVLNADENGGISKALNIHTNIQHLVSENNYSISLIGLQGEPSYFNVPMDTGKAIPEGKPALFTRRENQIVRLMSEGLTNEEIASRLFIALNTVKNHRKNILNKAGCRNIGQLITKCMTEGLI